MMDEVEHHELESLESLTFVDNLFVDDIDQE